MRPNQKLKSLISEEIKAVRKEQVLNEKRVAFFEAFANSPVDSFSELEKIEVVRYMLAEEILTEEMLTEENLDEVAGLARGAWTLGKAALGPVAARASAMASKYAPMVHQTSKAGKAMKAGQGARLTGLGGVYEKLRKSPLGSFFFGKVAPGQRPRFPKGWLPAFAKLKGPAGEASKYAVPTALAALLGIPAAAAAALLGGDQEPTPEQTEKIRSAVAQDAGAEGGGGATAGGGALPADWSRFAGQSDQHAAMARKWVEANGGTLNEEATDAFAGAKGSASVAGHTAPQTAALPSDPSFSAFQDWYKKNMGKEGGHFGPARAIELIDQAAPGAAAPEAAPEAPAPEAPAPAPEAPAPAAAGEVPATTSTSPIQGVLDKQTAAYSEKLQGIIAKYSAKGPEEAIRKSELFRLYPELKKDFKVGSGGMRPTVTSSEVVDAAKNAMAKLKASTEKAQRQAGKTATRGSRRQARIAGVQRESTINESTYNRWQTLIRN